MIQSKRIIKVVVFEEMVGLFYFTYYTVYISLKFLDFLVLDNNEICVVLKFYQQNCAAKKGERKRDRRGTEKGKGNFLFRCFF